MAGMSTYPHPNIRSMVGLVATGDKPLGRGSFCPHYRISNQEPWNKNFPGELKMLLKYGIGSNTA